MDPKMDPKINEKIDTEATRPLGRAPGRLQIPPGLNFGLTFNDFLTDFGRILA